MYDTHGIELYGSGGVIEQVGRNQRLHFVIGFVAGRCGTLQFVNRLSDYKGTLTADITGRHLGLEAAIRAAWEACGEDSVEFVFRAPVEPEQWEKCRKCDARIFCEKL